MSSEATAERQGIGMRRPAELYTPSARAFPTVLPDISYPGHYEIRSVHGNGCIRWKSQELFVSEALSREAVGIQAIEGSVVCLFWPRSPRKVQYPMPSFELNTPVTRPPVGVGLRMNRASAYRRLLTGPRKLVGDFNHIVTDVSGLNRYRCLRPYNSGLGLIPEARFPSPRVPNPNPGPPPPSPS